MEIMDEKVLSRILGKIEELKVNISELEAEVRALAGDGVPERMEDLPVKPIDLSISIPGIETVAPAAGPVSVPEIMVPSVAVEIMEANDETMAEACQTEETEPKIKAEPEVEAMSEVMTEPKDGQKDESGEELNEDMPDFEDMPENIAGNETDGTLVPDVTGDVAAGPLEEESSAPEAGKAIEIPIEEEAVEVAKEPEEASVTADTQKEDGTATERPKEEESPASLLDADSETSAQKTEGKHRHRRMVMDTVSKEKAVMDVLEEKEAWRFDMPGLQVKNIISAISLNDRLLLINTLFREDPVLFQDTIKKLNSMASFSEAVAFTKECFPEWNLNSEPVYRLMMAVRRKLR